MLLALKLFLAPALVGGVTLGARRWGPRIGGWLTALPVVAGPTLCFYAVEQGTGFGARAAQSTLVGLVGLASFSIVYSYSSMRLKWPASLLAGWVATLVTTLCVFWLPANLIFSMVMALASVYIARRCLPAGGHVPTRGGNLVWDIVLRMLSAVVLVVALTSLATRLGPNVSGFLTPFPIAAAIIAVFTHVRQGSKAVITFFHGFLPALNCFACFCFVLAIGLQPLGVPLAILAALATQLTVQGFMLWRMT